MNALGRNTYLKWGHRTNRRLLTLTLLIAMSASIGLKGYWLFNELRNNQSQTEVVTSDKLNETPQLKLDDFKLLFGYNDQPEAKSDSADIPKTRLSLVLRGALAGIENKNYASAIIQGSSQDKLYEIGETVPGGATLAEVYSDHVVLNLGGQLETLSFPESGKDSRALQEYQPITETKQNTDTRPGYNNTPDGKSLEDRMQDLRDKLQQANQGN